MIKGVKISGWRSFSTRPAKLNGLERINLVVGPNNSGKSNLSRFIGKLREWCVPFAKVDPHNPEEHWRKLLAVDCAVGQEDFWGWGNHPILFTFLFSAKSLRLSPAICSQLGLLDEILEADITITPKSNGATRQCTLEIMPKDGQGRPLFRVRGGNHEILVDGEYTSQVLDSHIHRGTGIAVARWLCENVLDIQAMRHLFRSSELTSRLSSDGGKIVQRLAAIRGSDIAQWESISSDIGTWLARILGETRPVQILFRGSDVELRFERGSVGFRCSMADLGSGVVEAFILLAFLRINSTSECLILVDEIEAHLHPASVLELMRIVQKNFPMHQIIVSTHSTTMVDAISESWTLHRCLMMDDGSTEFRLVDTTRERLALLDSLGLQPTQLFLANSVIWVEGPTDVMYLQLLLRNEMPNLLPSKDYSFAFYGGASGKYLAFSGEDTNDALVKLFEVSGRVAVICDKDLKAEGGTLLALLNGYSQNYPGRAMVASPAFGLEIENLLKPNVLKDITIKLRRTRLNNPKRPIVYGDYTFSDKDAFDVVVANAVSTVGGKEPTDAERKTIRGHMTALKPDIARAAQTLCESGEEVFSDEARAWAKELGAWLNYAQRGSANSG